MSLIKAGGARGGGLTFSWVIVKDVVEERINNYWDYYS